MSIGNFDLNIQNYSFKDIEKFFKINSKKKYTASDIEEKEYTIREQLLTSGHVDKKVKADLIDFLKNAKEWIIKSICDPPKAPTIVPNNFRLDTSNYPRSAETISRENELIDKPRQQFIYTSNSDCFPGTLNPLEKRIITKNISIDSLFRPNFYTTTSTDFTYVFPEQLNNITSMKLTSLEIPNMWHNYSSKNYTNQFTINLYNMVNITDSATGEPIQNISHMVYIPDGNYDSNTFPIAINQYFSNIGNGLQLLVLEVSTTTSNTVIRVKNKVYDANSSYYVYEPNNPYYSPGFYFDVMFGIQDQPQIPLYNTMGWMMGFRQPCYEVNINNSFINNSISNQGSIVFEGYLNSESSFGCNSINYIYLDVDDFQNNFATNSIITTNNATNNGLGRNVLARIILTTNSFTVSMDTAQDQIFKKREYFGPVKLEKLKIRILNKAGHVLDLIENNFSFLLEVTQLYT